MKALLSGSAAALMLFLAVPTHAESCTIGAVTSLAFGVYDVFAGSPLDTAGTVSYRCDNVSVLDTIKIQLSRGSSATFAPRTMRQGGDQLHYNLYLDPARSAVWGDGSAGTSQYGPSSPPEASSVLLNIYGRMPAHQSVRAGSYSDTVIITVVF